MTKRDYYRLCLTMPRAWLVSCAANPSPYMRASRLAIVRLAIRKLV
jgi:hypothetical protein